MDETAKYFTAAQFAAALGVTPKAIKLRLPGFAPSAQIKVRGQSTNAWTLDKLPPALARELTAMAAQRGLRNVDLLLAAPPAPWQPPVAWHNLRAQFRKLAERHCEIFAPLLLRQHELPGLLDRAAVAYRQNFGNEIAADRLRYILDRATKRDNGFNQFDRPGLYLDEAAFRDTPAPLDHSAALKDALHGVNRGNPTADDAAHLFHAAFVHLEKIQPGARRDAKTHLVKELYAAVPGLYRPQSGSPGDTGKPLLTLRRRFNFLYTWWTGHGRTVDCLRDGRNGNAGRKGYRHEPCEKLILAHAAQLRGERGKVGNVDLAIKMLSDKKEICAACIERFHPDRLSASARQRLTPNKIQVACFKGAEAVRKIAPTHHTEWDTQPGDRFVTDDMTPNELTWDEVDGEIISGQSQLLYTEDEFSGYPLPFLLYFGHPNSRTITKSLELVLSKIGLPHIALLTERGVYANRLLAGERGVQQWQPFRDLQAMLKKHFEFDAIPDEWLEEIRKRELGFRDPAFRFKIQQAWSPQAKTVERSIYEFQKSASRLPGHAGFNQRNEKSRPMQDFDRRVASGKEHPGNEYLHLSDLRKNYELIMSEIEARPINGVRHRGRSPLAVWQEALAAKPLRKLPSEIEALLLIGRKPEIKVRTQGICLSLDKYEDAFYFNEHTGPLVDRKVAVRFNPDIPDYIYIEHPDTAQLLKVPRMITNRTTATKEELAKVTKARRAHINGALAEVGLVDNRFTSWVVRDSQHSPADLEKGAQIIADAEQHKQEKASAAREQKRQQSLAAVLGTSVAQNPRNLKRTGEGLELEREAQAEIVALEKAKQEESR